MNEKRRRILAAARQRFRRYGVRKTTMQEIARDAGVAVGTLYLYFEDKDDLVVAGAEEFVARHRRQAEEILAGSGSAGERLRQYLVARFRAAEETRRSSRHAAELARAVLRVKPDRLWEEAALMEETIARLLRLGVEAGEFTIDPAEQDARVLLFAVAIFFPSALTELPSPPKEEDLLLVVDWFLRAWRRTAAPHARRKR
jgi:AcrR family transcriptional regulator